MDSAEAVLARSPVLAAAVCSALAAAGAPALTGMPEGWAGALVRDSRVWRNAAAALVLGALALVTFTASDYGYGADEAVQSRHGRDIYDWYANALSGHRRGFRSDTPVMNYYGGCFELLAEAAARVSPLGATTTRHLVTAWFGVLGLAGAYLLGCTLHSRAVGCASVLLLLLYPAFYGHFFSNPKDVPFAVAMLFALLAICRSLPHLPRLPPSRVLVVGGAIGVAMGIRVGGILALGYLAIALAWWLAGDALRRRAQVGPRAPSRLPGLLWSGAGALCVAWLVMLACWPWAQAAPLARPWQAVVYFQDIVEQQRIDFPVFFEGRYYPLSDTPRYFTLKLLALTMPEVLLPGLLLAPATLLRLARRGAAWPGARGMARILTALAIALPLATTASDGIIQYDGIRHYLFVVPPAVVLVSAVLVSWLGGAGSRQRRAAIAAAVVLLAATTAWDMGRLHPYQYTYFNRTLAGGLRLASQSYETDYLGLSYREGVRWALANYPGPGTRPVRITICKGWQASLDDALASAGASRERFVPVPWNTPADLAVAATRRDCHRSFAGEVLAAIGPAETPLVYVIDLFQ